VAPERLPASLLCCLLSLLVACLVPAFASASENDQLVNGDSALRLIGGGEYERGLEQLRRAYQLFPLNPANRHNLADGQIAYGRHLMKQKRYDQADESFVKAQELYPEDPSVSLLRGICNYFLKRYDIARYELERSRLKRPASVESLYYLGLVLYETDRRLQAVELWEEALKLAPERLELVEVLKRSRREMAVESGMDRGHSSRFDLTYDSDVDTSFALAVLDVLENAANQVGAELGYFPRPRVPVAIYRRADFKVVTDSPEWSGGVYDGTIRLPFGSLKEITPQLRAVLHHEYAHVIVFELTRGNCPYWLNEGIAEMFGRKQYSRPMTEFEEAARKKSLADFSKLESGFGSLSAVEANLAYQQSYSLVSYLVTNYGWHRVTRILTGLGDGMSLEVALAEALKEYSLSYAALLQEWRESIERGMAPR
jgi:tetratricopeptide (TPR) repeat protein